MKNLGHNLGKATWSGQIYLFSIRTYFRTFFGLKKALIPSLTYSAMILHWNEKVTLISHKAAEIIEMYSTDGDSLEYAAIVSVL